MNRCRRIVDQFLYRACVDRRLAMLGTPLGPRSLVTLFAGAGGADVGLKDAGWHGKLMVERDPPAAATLVAAREQGFIDGEVIKGDVNLVDYTPWRGVGLLWSSFPCQGFSPSGKGKGIEDERDGWPGTVRAIDQLQPRWFIGENSSGLARGKQKCTLANVMLADLKKRFPYADFRVLSAADIGVPQKRERVILVAGPRPIQWPKPTHVEITDEMRKAVLVRDHGYSPDDDLDEAIIEFGYDDPEFLDASIEKDLAKRGLKPFVTLAEALGYWTRLDRWEPLAMGLREPEFVAQMVKDGMSEDEAESRFGSEIEHYECRICGLLYDYCRCDDSDFYGVLGSPAPTVLAGLKKGGGGGAGRRGVMTASKRMRDKMDASFEMLGERSGYSPAEAAAIQGFPPGYPFQGTAEYQLFGQIGNAVPPKLAEVIARAVAEADASFGSANVVTDQGYHRTAISRDQPSLPLRHLQEHHPQLLQGRVLDFGSGRGSDCEAIKARCYDPHHPKQSVRKSPTGTFDTVMMTYVANVLPKSERAKAVKRAAQMVRKGGSIVISARSKSDSGYQSAKAWTKHGDGYAKLTDQGTIQRFQRFYDGDELRLEMDALVGSGFQRIQIRPIGGHTEAVAYRRIR